MELWNYCFQFGDQHEIFRLAIQFVLFLDDLTLPFRLFNLVDDAFLSFKNVFDFFESAFSSQKIFSFEQNWGFRLQNVFEFFADLFLLSVQKLLQLSSGKCLFLIFFIHLNCGHFILNQFFNRPENRFFTLGILDFDSTFVPVSFFITQVFDKFVKINFLLCCFLWLTDDETLQRFIRTFLFFKLNFFKLFAILQQF